MATTSLFVAFLRGMNVGGHRLTNGELCAHFVALGFTDVATFRASGNVIFAGVPDADEALAERIEDGLRGLLGYAVPTFIRSDAEVVAIAESSPVAEELVAASRGKLQVALLAQPASPSARRQVLKLAGEEDLLSFGPRELFWLPSGGILDSPLDMKAIEALLGPMTIRTKNTIEQIAARHLGHSPAR